MWQVPPPSTEYDSQVSPELHKRILTLLHEDDAIRLDKLLKSLASTEHEITESTLFMVYGKRNLLHIASYIQARHCVRLLANPPYAWNVDCLDARNRTPLDFAETRDDLAVLIELDLQSQELRRWNVPLPEPEFGGHPATLLIWPQDHCRKPLKRTAMVGVRSVGISGCFRDLGGQFVYKTRMIGPHAALLFELFMATPSLFAFNVWNGEELTTLNVKNRFWPVPALSDYRLEELPVHEDCTVYPQCLYETSLACFRLGVTDQNTLLRLGHIWMCHRFGLRRLDHVRALCFTLIPSLLDLCRMMARRLLVQHMVANQTEINYFQTLRKLNLPDSIEQFLLYRSVWDSGTEWEKHLTDGHGGNVPYGFRLTVQHVEHSGDCGKGILINHRFIPDRAN